jgi:hypothetical protein
MALYKGGCEASRPGRFIRRGRASERACVGANSRAGLQGISEEKSPLLLQEIEKKVSSIF